MESQQLPDQSLLSPPSTTGHRRGTYRLQNNKEIDPLVIDEVLYEKISYAINNFLDNIMVNAEEKILRINRKLLLAECKNVISSFFNFSILQIDD